MTQKPFAASMASSVATSSAVTSSGRRRPVSTNAVQSRGRTASASCASKESGATASDDSCVNAKKSAWHAMRAVRRVVRVGAWHAPHRCLRRGGSRGFQAEELQQEARQVLRL
jgi:hypothetical protein